MGLPQILLGLLREPASGYDLKARFSTSVGNFWSAELSQIYPTLRRMESDGWLESRGEPSERGPERKVYSVTESGRSELRRWLLTGPQVGTERFEYLAQLFFMDELASVEATRDFLHSLRTRLQAWLAELRVFESEFASVPGFPDDLPPGLLHPHFTLRMGVLSLHAKIAWCDESIARLEKRAAAATSEKG